MHRVLLLCLCAAALAGEIDPQEWRRLQKETAELAPRKGELARKYALIEALLREDSARSTRLLVDLAGAAATRRDQLAPKVEKARADLRKHRQRLRKKHGRHTSNADLETDPKYRAKREAVVSLEADFEADVAVLEAIGVAFASLRATESAAVLVDRKDRKVAAARRASEVRRGTLAALWHQPGPRFVPDILAFAADAKLPEARARVLGWVAEKHVKAGYDVAVACLRAKEDSVARAAVAALKALDDARCVPHLVAARKKAAGLLADELELALHYFTGRTFVGAGAGAMWEGWWRREGAAWLERVRAERHPEAPELPAHAEFYGIGTRSDRIVFVLDRSDSMQHPVPQHGPVSGSKRDDSRVPGKTKLEVAKNQLERTIKRLDPRVKFAVVFYSHDVHVWRKPPGLVPATADNKRKAIDWFHRIDHAGSTMIFDALDKALEYAKTGGGKSKTDPRGADTIFLPSDGAPTMRGGHDLLTGPDLEKAVAGFLDANRPFRCVVHTIGVGPDHNRPLMQRLAAETGGTYKAVGVK